MATGSFISALNGGVVRIYSGAVPANAGAALGAAVLLSEINSAALNGLHLDPVPVNGFVYKDSSEVWSDLANAAGGLATFYRHVLVADDGTESTSALRVQGSVGLLNADMILKYTTLVIGEPQPITSYMVYMPNA
jgi:hypothetical protein